MLPLLFANDSAAMPSITIEAEVDPSLMVIRGRMTIEAEVHPNLIDPLRDLPVPDDDLWSKRTFPGLPEQGAVRFGPIDDHTWWFYTLLPERYEDVGSIPRFGLFANGAWYPQPLLQGEPIVAEWRVKLELPPDTAGAVGDEAGAGTLRWMGEAERVSVAVIPRGQVTELYGEDLRIAVLTRGRPRRVLLDQLRHQLQAMGADSVLDGVVAVAPLRRRLVRSGAGLAYVSDRAWRTTPGTRRFHHAAVARGVTQALIDNPSPQARELAAAALSRGHAAALRGLDARRLLGFGAWLPSIQAVLYDGQMPFASEVFEESHPSDPVRDDLMERFAPHAPGTVVAAQIELADGELALHRLGVALAAGESLADAAESAGVPYELLLAWQEPYPERQDYRVDGGSGITVVRSADADAPTERVVVAIDGTRTTWAAEPTDSWTLPADVRRVVVDPDRYTAQSSRVGDAWPPRFQPTATAWIETVDPNRQVIEAGAVLTIRRSWDTRNLWLGSLYSDEQTLLGANLAYVRRAGPTVDGLRRAHRIAVSFGPALLDPRFSSIEPWTFALGGGLSYAFDNRVDLAFPLEGRRFAASVDGGFVPDTGETYFSVRASAAGVVAPHPRHAFAGNASLGLARGQVEHRLLPLGGDSGLRSIPPDAVIATERAVARGEYRVAVLRNSSVPLGLVWGSELQLTAGLEAGLARANLEPEGAFGATAGLVVVGEWFGMQPAMLGATAGWSLWSSFGIGPDPVPAWHIRWGQEF